MSETYIQCVINFSLYHVYIGVVQGGYGVGMGKVIRFMVINGSKS